VVFGLRCILTNKNRSMEANAKYTYLQSLSLLQTLDERYISQISNQSTIVTYKKGELLFNTGDAINYVYIIKSGSIKVGLNTSGDKILIKEIAYENELVGENIFNELTERRQFAEVLTDSEIVKIPSAYFKSLIDHNPMLCHEVTKVLISKLSNIEQRMSNFILKKAQNRIYGFLKNMAINNGIKIGIDEILINHGLSHKEIANITDTSRQTVARVLSELKKLDVIHFSARKPHKILIRNMAMLS